MSSSHAEEPATGRSSSADQEKQHSEELEEAPPDDTEVETIEETQTEDEVEEVEGDEDQTIEEVTEDNVEAEDENEVDSGHEVESKVKADESDQKATEETPKHNGDVKSLASTSKDTVETKNTNESAKRRSSSDRKSTLRFAPVYPQDSQDPDWPLGQPVKRKRGRPRKHPPKHLLPKRPRGRPRKVRPKTPEFEQYAYEPYGGSYEDITIEDDLPEALLREYDHNERGVHCHPPELSRFLIGDLADEMTVAVKEGDHFRVLQPEDAFARPVDERLSFLSGNGVSVTSISSLDGAMEYPASASQTPEPREDRPEPSEASQESQIIDLMLKSYVEDCSEEEVACTPDASAFMEVFRPKKEWSNDDDRNQTGPEWDYQTESYKFKCRFVPTELNIMYSFHDLNLIRRRTSMIRCSMK